MWCAYVFILLYFDATKYNSVQSTAFNMTEYLRPNTIKTTKKHTRAVRVCVKEKFKHKTCQQLIQRRLWHHCKAMKTRLSPKLTGWMREAVIREAGWRPMVTLGKLQRPTAQVGESVDMTSIIHMFIEDWQEENQKKKKDVVTHSIVYQWFELFILSFTGICSQCAACCCCPSTTPAPLFRSEDLGSLLSSIREEDMVVAGSQTYTILANKDVFKHLHCLTELILKMILHNMTACWKCI